MLQTIVIIGRPNVGKSTLFNRLCGKKIALVHDLPGVTRDWREGHGHLGDLDFAIIDTAGLDGFEEIEIRHQIQEKTESLLEKADAILFLVDAREGITASEQGLAKLLRKWHEKVILAANKSEKNSSQHSNGEFYKLGYGDPLPLSAAHGEGLIGLYEALKKFIDMPEADVGLDLDLKEEKPLQLAIIGRPNAGKSTLINKLLGEDRLLTGDMPGVTRDAIALNWEFSGKKIHLIDTAGLRRKSKITDTLESLAAGDSLKAIRFAQVVVLVIDAAIPLEKQDLTLASQVLEEGRILVIAVNKWDTVKPRALEEIQYLLEKTLPQAKGVFCVPISALKGKNLETLMTKVLDAYQHWNRRLSTGVLNRWLQSALERHPPQLVGGNRLRIKYITQIKTRPPTFALFVTKPAELAPSYEKYLINSLREAFDLPGIPIRFLIRKGKNPYQGSE